jgi:hypothetical protein
MRAFRSVCAFTLGRARFLGGEAEQPACLDPVFGGFAGEVALGAVPLGCLVAAPGGPDGGDAQDQDRDDFQDLVAPRWLVACTCRSMIC